MDDRVIGKPERPPERSIELTVPGEPMGKQRPRWSRYGSDPRQPHTPTKTKNYEVYIKELFVQKYPGFEPMNKPLKLLLAAYLTIPKSKSKKIKDLMGADVLRPTKAPDLDNCLKIVMDALQGLVFINDAQVTSIRAIKRWSHVPRIEIEIRDYDNIDR